MFWTIFLLVVGGAWSLAYLWTRKDPPLMRKNLPPGPIGLPIIGNLGLLGELPHRELHSLAKQYGPIMYLRLGYVPTIVVSSPQAAEQFLKTHDLVFASRPYTEAAKYMSYGRKGLSFSEYGPYWRNVRKLCTMQLLTQTKIDSFRSIRREELVLMVGSLGESARARATVDLSAASASLIANMTCRMVFGRKFMDEELDERGFKGVIQEAMKLAAAFNIADYIPLVGVLDLQGLTRRMKAFSKVIDVFFERNIEEHVRERDREHDHRDFVDVMLSLLESDTAEFQIDRTNIKAIMLDMLAGGMDTSATTVEWAMSELLRNPDVMKKLQEEMESVVGKDRLVEESDLARLEYLEMVVKETMRLHPVGPLLIPHESMEDCVVNGYHIPKKSRIIINIWAIGRDSSAWENAQDFLPERFIGTDIDMRGNDFRFLPFGYGRRGCPGMQLGLAVVRLVLAQLVHCFDWELPEGMSPTNLDMREVFGLTIPRATHLLAVPTCRSPLC